jgi:hypothetical protein
MKAEAVCRVLWGCGIMGELILTNYQIIWTPNIHTRNECEVFVHFGCVQRIEKGKAKNLPGVAYLLKIHTKDYRKIKLGSFFFPHLFLFLSLNFFSKGVTTVSQANNPKANLYDTIFQMAFPHSITQVFAFIYHTAAKKMTSEQNGWKLYDMQAEYKRMGIPSSEWRITEMNKSFKFRSEKQNKDKKKSLLFFFSHSET